MSIFSLLSSSESDIQTTRLVVLTHICCMPLLQALFLLVIVAVKYYQKRQAYIEMMKPENFERHLQKVR